MIRFAFVAEKNPGFRSYYMQEFGFIGGLFSSLAVFLPSRLRYIPRIPLESPNFSSPKPTKSCPEDSVRYIDRAGKKIDLFLVPPLPLHLQNYI